MASAQIVSPAFRSSMSPGTTFSGSIVLGGVSLFSSADAWTTEPSFRRTDT